MRTARLSEVLLPNLNKEIIVNMSDEKDDVVARRKALAEALRNGQDVVVAPSGEVEFKSEAQEDGQTAIQVPNGKLA